MSSIVILGGGISGLSTAHYLMHYFPCRVTLLEASNRWGGWVKSNVQSNGLVFEQGPRTLRRMGYAGTNTLNLLDDLGMMDLVVPISSDNDAFKKRYIYTKGKLHTVEGGLRTLFRVLPPMTKPMLSCLWKDLRAPMEKLEDDSVYNFIQRRFGSELADYFISPLICGICGGDAKKISIKMLAPELFDYEQAYGSVLKGMFKCKGLPIGRIVEPLEPVNASKLSHRALMNRWQAFTIREGLETLIKALRLNVRDRIDMRMNARCMGVDLEENYVDVEDGTRLPFDKLICTLPSFEFASLLKGKHTFVKERLEAIPYANMVTVNVALEGEDLAPKGFGLLVPPLEGGNILGITFDSSYYPSPGYSVLTVMMGGYRFGELGSDLSEERMLKLALEGVEKILGLKGMRVAASKVSVLKDCIPQQVVGHEKRMSEVRDYVKERELPLSLVGNAYGGVGINAALLEARNCAILLGREMSSSQLRPEAEACN